LVLIPYDEIWSVPFLEVSSKQSICTNIKREVMPPTASKSASRSVSNNLIVQKTPPKGTEMNPEFSFVG